MRTDKLTEIIVAKFINGGTPDIVKEDIDETYELNVPFNLIDEIHTLLEDDLDVLHGYLESYMTEDIQEVIYDRIYELYDRELLDISNKYKMTITFQND